MFVVRKPLLAACVPTVLFITSGKMISVMILLYSVISTYENITVHEFRLVLECSTAVISIPRMLSLGIY